MIRRSVSILVMVFCLATARVSAQEAEPFSLDAYSAIQAIWMLRRVGFLQRYHESARPETITVREVRAIVIERDTNPSPPNRSRYDILLNGDPLDWENLYIMYDGRMTNLKLLFTYRNQRPVPDGPYLIPAGRHRTP